MYIHVCIYLKYTISSQCILGNTKTIHISTYMYICTYMYVYISSIPSPHIHVLQYTKKEIEIEEGER